jgi:hypothetical protein
MVNGKGTREEEIKDRTTAGNRAYCKNKELFRSNHQKHQIKVIQYGNKTRS